jgi:hypothetical protein
MTNLGPVKLLPRAGIPGASQFLGWEIILIVRKLFLKTRKQLARFSMQRVAPIRLLVPVRVAQGLHNSHWKTSSE